MLKAGVAVAASLLIGACSLTFAGESAEECFRTIAYDPSSSVEDTSRYDRFFVNVFLNIGLPEDWTEADYTNRWAATLGIPAEEVDAFIVASTHNVTEELGPSTDPGADSASLMQWEEAWGRDFWRRWIETHPDQAAAFCDTYTPPPA